MIKNFSDHSANERTFLAWVRTSIAVMAFGFIVEKFDLFLEIAAPSLTGRTLSVPGQKFGNVAGLMLIIPFIGDFIAVIPPIVVGLLTAPLGNVIVALVALVLLQQLVLQVLRPKIMGRSVGLHPVLVLVAFLMGARASGIWGAFFSVPIAGVLQSVVSLVYQRYVAESQALTAASAYAGAEPNPPPGAPGSPTA